MVDAILDEINKIYIYFAGRLEREGTHVDVNKDISPVLHLSLLIKKEEE